MCNLVSFFKKVCQISAKHLEIKVELLTYTKIDKGYNNKLTIKVA